MSLTATPSRPLGFYRSVHRLFSPGGRWILEFRRHTQLDYAVDLWLFHYHGWEEVATNGQLQIAITEEMGKSWGFDSENLYIELDERQNGVEGSSSCGYSLDFCRSVWRVLADRGWDTDLNRAEANGIAKEKH